MMKHVTGRNLFIAAQVLLICVASANIYSAKKGIAASEALIQEMTRDLEKYTVVATHRFDEGGSYGTMSERSCIAEVGAMIYVVRKGDMVYGTYFSDKSKSMSGTCKDGATLFLSGSDFTVLR